MLFEYVPVPCGCQGAVLNEVACPCEGCYKRELPERVSYLTLSSEVFLGCFNILVNAQVRDPVL